MKNKLITTLSLAAALCCSACGDGGPSPTEHVGSTASALSSPSGSPTFYVGHTSALPGTTSYPLANVSQYACVLMAVYGNISDPATQVKLTQGVVLWGLDLTSIRNYDNITAQVECVPYTMFYNHTPSLNISGETSYTWSNHVSYTQLWGNDAFCSLVGFGGSLAAHNGHIQAAQSSVFLSKGFWNLLVAAGADTTDFGMSQCFSFTNGSDRPVPTVWTSPDVNGNVHTVNIPNINQALCGIEYLNAGSGGFVNGGGINIDPYGGTFNNSSGISDYYPISRVSCINYYVP
jgi:hypothetical protein